MPPCSIPSKAIRPIKALGQVFLTHQATADALVAALDLHPGETVLEIGPGKGILTQRLIEKGCQVIAVEIDKRLVCFLKNRFAAAENLTLIEQDFLEFDMSNLRRVKIIGNLPYYISSQILFKLIENRLSWHIAVLTTQREFAERVLGKPGSRGYGALTVICAYLFSRRRLFNIPPSFFKPSPDVISTSFLLTRLSSAPVKVGDEEWFFTVVRAAFKPQRRKTLLNNLTSNLGLTKGIVASVLREIDLPLDIRAEDLNLEQFARLSEAVGKICR